jgi:hypothetical protein
MADGGCLHAFLENEGGARGIEDDARGIEDVYLEIDEDVSQASGHVPWGLVFHKEAF